MIIFLTVVEMFKCTSVNNYIYVETKEFLSKLHLRYQNVTTSSQSQMKTSDWNFFWNIISITEYSPIGSRNQKLFTYLKDA